MTIANLITLARVALVPVILYLLIEGLYGPALALFVLAGISDAVDGAIARFFDQRSDLGVVLDPLADKLLLVSVFIVLGVIEALPAWLVVLAVSRDVVIVAGVVIARLFERPIDVAPLMVSKVNTTAQILLAAFVMALLAGGWQAPGWVLVGALATGALTVASLVAYAAAWLRHMSEA